ncbi:MAG TPA: hypothetical protein VN669_16265, partial [Candidatus Acidoferrales bacterium]|nr:hypothetical protein [Candidatus Acidoferrales bacterium]
ATASCAADESQDQVELHSSLACFATQAETVWKGIPPRKVFFCERKQHWFRDFCVCDLAGSHSSPVQDTKDEDEPGDGGSPSRTPNHVSGLRLNYRPG